MDAAIEALSKVDAIVTETRDPYLVSRILARREAVVSSSIEGTNSTLDELLAVEEASDEQTRTAAKQVRDYAVTLEKLIPLAVDQGPAVFTEELIRDLHVEVMKSDPDYRDVPGRLREVVVWVGGGGNIAYSTWNPPPPEDVRRCLRETVDFMRNEGMQQMTQNLVTRLAIAHAHFEAVHPFRDGNGRVGRILLPLMMAADGRVPLYLSPYIEANKAAYFDALKEAQQRLRWEAMAGFMSDAIVGIVDELMVSRRALNSLRQEWLGRRKFRKGSASLRALDVLPHFPVVTANRLSELLEVSVPQAMQAVSQLEAIGILKERTGYARNRIFAAAEALEIINRPFGQEPAERQSLDDEEDDKSADFRP